MLITPNASRVATGEIEDDRVQPELEIRAKAARAGWQVYEGGITQIELPAPWRDSAVSVVMPTYNEAENLPRIAESVLSLPLPNLRLMIVDDNSPDGTGTLADELAQKYKTGEGRPRLGVLHRAAKNGLGRAYVDGMTRALADGAQFIVQMDADGSHLPEYIPQMLGASLSTGAGVVIGSRYIVGGALADDWGRARRALSSWANFYVHSILGEVARDTTSGYNLWQRGVLESIKLATIGSNGYSFQVEMKYRALKKGIKMLEIPIRFEERHLGVSKMGLSTQIESALMPLRLRRRYRRGHVA